jgi:ribonuclease D
MIAPPLSEPVWIDTTAALECMAADLKHYSQIGVDTESNSLFAYKERVCLIQFSTPTTDYLLDPFPFDDLNILAPIFADPNVEKIFHAAEYDIICLKRDYGFVFNHVFDTMLTAKILGKKEVGLGNLLEAEFGVTVNKHFQRANWGIRPIEPALMAYARMDTHYLIALRQRMQAALTASGLESLALEDFNRISQVEPPVESNSCNWRISGSQQLDPIQLSVLCELWHYRDQRAEQANLPLFKVMSNQVLLNVARSCPKTKQDLAKLEGLTSRLIERHGEGLLHAVESGLQKPPKPQRNKNCSKPSDEYLQRIEALRNWRRITGMRYKVESDVILPRDLMEKIAQRNPTSEQDLEQVMKDFPWRFQQLGKQILEVLQTLERGKK